MSITLLGTGAAAGWPRPGCPCASCAGSATAGHVRGATTALLGGTLRLVDGPEVDGERVRAGERVRRDAYDVRVLAAGGPEQVLLDVTGPEGRVLWAPHTGPLPEDTVAALRDADLDVVLLDEEGGDPRSEPTGHHLDLTSFPEELRRLRAVGAVTARTDVVAVGLGHHNPATPELARRLRDWGARVVDDGDTLSADRVPAPRRRTLVVGGVRSGKSHEAERILAAEEQVTYAATSHPAAGDDEWSARVREHRARRPDHWSTVETLDLVGLLAVDGEPLLVDCLTLWLTRVLDRLDGWDDHAWATLGEDAFATELDSLVDAWRSTRRRVVAVTNEVGQGVVPDTATGRRFRDLMGRVNARVAAECEDVRWCLAGRVVEI